MIKVYKAKRLSEGNRLFPCRIVLEDKGIVVRFPGFMSGKETFISYLDISSMGIDTPFIGFSTLKFNAKGQKIEAHGFTRSDAKRIQSIISEMKSKLKK